MEEAKIKLEKIITSFYQLGRVYENAIPTPTVVVSTTLEEKSSGLRELHTNFILQL